MAMTEDLVVRLDSPSDIYSQDTLIHGYSLDSSLHLNQKT